jgi:hypothetical protein
MAFPRGPFLHVDADQTVEVSDEFFAFWTHLGDRPRGRRSALGSPQLGSRTSWQ